MKKPRYSGLGLPRQYGRAGWMAEVCSGQDECDDPAGFCLRQIPIFKISAS